MDREPHTRYASGRQDRLQAGDGTDEPSTAVSLPAGHRTDKGRILPYTSLECGCSEMILGTLRSEGRDIFLHCLRAAEEYVLNGTKRGRR